MTKIRAFKLGPAFRVGITLTSLLWAVCGGLWLLFAAWLGNTLGDLSPAQLRQMGVDPRQLDQLNLPLAAYCQSYICCGPALGIVGGLFGTLVAALYNLTVRITGGLEVTLEAPPPPSLPPVL